MNKFKTGDRCIVVDMPGDSINGKEVTIQSNGDFMYNIFFMKGVIVYKVDIHLPSIDGCDLVGIPELNLKLIYDGDEKSSWEDMKDIYQPKELEKCPSELVTKEVNNA